VLYYELARQLYRDVQEFYAFVTCSKSQEFLPKILRALGDQEFSIMPKDFTEEDQIKNMFLGALTWVLFHELSHLQQEHGYIRSKFITSGCQLINECDVFSSARLTEKDAAIYHVTELAADFEAISFCISELQRHFKADIFLGAAYLFVCGISCCFYRFNCNYLDVESVPVGSHPNPIVRMELSIQQLIEFLDFDCFPRLVGFSMDRKKLVYFFNQAVFISSIFWHMTSVDSANHDLERLVLKPVSEPVRKSYFKAIIDTWDEIVTDIRAVRRSEPPFSLLTFTDEFRELVR
jgi:hypothetical protein